MFAGNKKRESIRHIPVIIYSTAIDETLSYTAIALGAASCIKKTNSINNLVETLKSLLIAK